MVTATFDTFTIRLASVAGSVGVLVAPMQGLVGGYPPAPIRH